MNRKNTKQTVKDDPLAPRKLDWSKAVRGKYYDLYAKGTNIAVIDPDLMETYPDSQAVSDALRAVRDVKLRLAASAPKSKERVA